MNWTIALLILVCWAIVALPLAVAVGRAFAAAHLPADPELELSGIGSDAPFAPPLDESGHGSAA